MFDLFSVLHHLLHIWVSIRLLVTLRGQSRSSKTVTEFSFWWCFSLWISNIGNIIPSLSCFPLALHPRLLFPIHSSFHTICSSQHALLPQMARFSFIHYSAGEKRMRGNRLPLLRKRTGLRPAVWDRPIQFHHPLFLTTHGQTQNPISLSSQYIKSSCNKKCDWSPAEALISRACDRMTADMFIK